MDTKVIDEINNKTDIVALISSYVKLERRGKNYFGLCPFHDDNNPSMSVSPEKNFFKCFSCGVGGGPINFYQQINHTTFPEAVRALGEPLGLVDIVNKVEKKEVVPEFAILEEVNNFYMYTLQNSKLGIEALKYLKNRKLKDETIKHFNIGLAPKNDVIYKLLKQKKFTDEQILDSGIVSLKNNEYKDFFNERIMFPITNINGKVIAFSGRALKNQTPKYYNSGDSKIFNKGEVLYHLHEALGDIRKQGFVIIHEGFFDCISSYEAGIKNTVATMGTALTLNQARQLEKYTKRVVLAFDGDNAGINAAIKAIDVLSQTKMRIDVLKLDENLDPDDYIKKYGKEKYLKLFKEGLLDQYEFIYTSTKEGLNLNNANDASILKTTTKEMLRYANNSIKELYAKRLSEDLKVTISNLSNELFKEVRQRPTKEVKKVAKRTLASKYYLAEKQLLISMFKDKELTRRIDQELSSVYFCNRRAFDLRIILLFKYYEKYDAFDEKALIDLVNEEDSEGHIRDYLDEIFKSIEYKEGFIYTEEDIEKQIAVVKDVVNKKAYLKLKEEIKNEPESYQKTILLEQFREEKLKQLKWKDKN